MTSDNFNGGIFSISTSGASCGIGEGVAIHLARLGCRVAVTGRNEVNLKHVREECIKAGLSDDQVFRI